MGGEQRRQHQERAGATLALRRQFTANGEVLERVEVFKYLGGLLSQEDNDMQAVRHHLVKACGMWAQVGSVL